MTITTEQYGASASQATNAVEYFTDFWSLGVRTMSNQMFPGVPQVDLAPAVERYFQVVQRTVNISRDFTLKWVEASGVLADAFREQADAVADLARTQAESTRDLVHEQADKAEQDAHDQAEKTSRAGQSLARETRETAERAERDQARQASRPANEKAGSTAGS
jgi:hypothetical protein